MTVISKDTYKLLILSKLKGVGPSTLQRLPQIADFSTLDVLDLADFDKKVEKALSVPGALDDAREKAEKDVEYGEKDGAFIISFLDQRFPTTLRSIPLKECPPLLFCKGNIEPLSKRSVTIIGTREPTADGITTAQRITKYFSQEGWSIVSGLALGIDGISHQACIDSLGHTVAVLAHGLQTIAPKRHQKLADEILENGGALVTEYSYGIAPFATNFVKRDRIQAALGMATILVQTAERGGSWHASRASIRYGRPLAFPHPSKRDIQNTEPKIAGIQALLNEDWRVKYKQLQCAKREDLNLLFQINSKHDYPRLEDWIESKFDYKPKESQINLFE